MKNSHKYLDHPRCKSIQICTECGCIKETYRVSGFLNTLYQKDEQITKLEPLCQKNCLIESLESQQETV